MRTTLNQISNVLTGVTLKEKPIPTTQLEERIFLMQLGDLNIDGNIQTHTMISIPYQNSFDKFIVRTGDIVFRGRGAGIVAALVPKMDNPLVIASPLMIIRPNVQRVDSDYLVWALSNNFARRYYSEHSRGSCIIGIGKHDLDLFELDLPPLSVQKKIGQLKNLEKIEQNLLLRYQKSKTKLHEALIINALHKEKVA